MLWKPAALDAANESTRSSEEPAQPHTCREWLQPLDAANEPTRTYEDSAAGGLSCKLQQMVTGISHSHAANDCSTGCCKESTRTYEESAQPHTCRE